MCTDRVDCNSSLLRCPQLEKDNAAAGRVASRVRDGAEFVTSLVHKSAKLVTFDFRMILHEWNTKRAIRSCAVHNVLLAGAASSSRRSPEHPEVSFQTEVPTDPLPSLQLTVEKQFGTQSAWKGCPDQHLPCFRRSFQVKTISVPPCVDDLQFAELHTHITRQISRDHKREKKKAVD